MSAAIQTDLSAKPPGCRLDNRLRRPRPQLQEARAKPSRPRAPSGSVVWAGSKCKSCGQPKRAHSYLLCA
eukprot:g29545.t1